MFWLSIIFFIISCSRSAGQGEEANEQRDTSSLPASSSGASSSSRETPVDQETPPISSNARKRKRKRQHGMDDIEAALMSKLTSDVEHSCDHDAEEHFGLHVALILFCVVSHRGSELLLK